METSAVLGEFGYDWKPGAVVAFWAHSRWQIQRRPQKSAIEKSCGWELPGVPQVLQVPRMNVVRDEQKRCHGQLCLQDNKSVCAGEIWRALFRALPYVCAFSFFNTFEVLQSTYRWTWTVSCSEVLGRQVCLCSPSFSSVVKEPIKLLSK